jgi:2-dehydro-3-deoxygalactonokinase
VADWPGTGGLAASIDAGTSNTRVCLWHGALAVARAARPVGVRMTVLSGSRDALRQAVREALLEALDHAGAVASDLRLVVASGMITSAAGLHEVSHLTAPVGAAQLAAGMVRATVPQICPQSIWWVPGVRNAAAASGIDEIDALDMMRGEETEVIALIDRLGLTEEARLVLPGSHTKFVWLDAQQRIAACATTVSGELLQALSVHTLLAASVDSVFADTLDPLALEAGARAADAVGLARAAFGVRTLDVFGVADRNARACYLLGAVLASDVLALHKSRALQTADPSAPVLVSGRPLLRDALVHLLRRDRALAAPVNAVSDAQQADLAGWGACVLARQRALQST